jgi:hypothetical protein
VGPVSDPLLLRKSGSAGNRIRDLWICSQELWPLDHLWKQGISPNVWKHGCRKWRLYFPISFKQGKQVVTTESTARGVHVISNVLISIKGRGKQSIRISNLNKAVRMCLICLIFLKIYTSGYKNKKERHSEWRLRFAHSSSLHKTKNTGLA